MLKQWATILLASLAIFPLPAPVHAGGKDLSLVPTHGELAHKQIYSGSYALIVGINDYEHLPSQLHLHFAVADALSMRDILIKYYGFPADHVKMLLNADATKDNIEGALSDFADQETYKTDDRVLIFFSGHGQTVDLPGGGQEGFLIPVDAKVDLDHIDNAAPYLKSCVKMEEVWDYLQSMPAKHVLLIADACYSGILTQDRALAISPGALAAMASKRALQVMTAGGKGETSTELDEYGHGAFTYKLVEELKARAAEGPGNVFTSSELYGSVERSVNNLTNGSQDPQFGNYKTEGNFLFITTNPQSVPAYQVAESDSTPPSTDDTDQPDDRHQTYSPPDNGDDNPPAPAPQPAPPIHKTHPTHKSTSSHTHRAYNADALKRLLDVIEKYGGPDPLPADREADAIAAAKAALEAGADPNGIDSENEPILMTAVSEECEPVVKVLLQYNANPSTPRTGDGDTPAHMAQEFKINRPDLAAAFGE